MDPWQTLPRRAAFTCLLLLGNLPGQGVIDGSGSAAAEIAASGPTAVAARLPVRAKVRDTVVELTWDPPEGRAVTGYRVYRAGDDRPIHGEKLLKTPHFVDVGLSPGHIYTYRVRAVLADGTENDEYRPITAVAGFGIAGDELLQNPSNEAPLTDGRIPHWTEAAGSQWTRRESEPEPSAGEAYFFAPDESTAELRQDVDVSAYAESIAAGRQRFVFAGYVHSWDQSPADTARIVVEYRDRDNATVLASFDSGEIANVTRWQRMADVRAAPRGTARIRVRLISTRYNGSNNDGYFDGLSLRAVAPPAG